MIKDIEMRLTLVDRDSQYTSSVKWKGRVKADIGATDNKTLAEALFNIEQQVNLQLPWLRLHISTVNE